MSRIIVISGKQGSGKSTLAQKVQDMFGGNAKVYKFADVLYEIHDYIRDKMRSLGIERPEKDGPLLQLLGTEWGRNTVDQNLWPNILLNRLKQDTSAAVLIDDCRFENEFDIIKNTYGDDAIMIRLECPEAVRKARCPAWRPNTEHPSETGLVRYSFEGKFDIVYFTNEKSPEQCANDLQKQIIKRWP